MVSKSHSVPEQGSVTGLGCLPVSVLANYVLNCVKLRPAVVGVDDDLSSADLALLFSVHQRLLLYLRLSGCLVLLSLSSWAYDFVLVRGWLLLLLIGVALLLLESNAVVV